LLRQSITSGDGGGMAWNGYMNVAQHNHKQSINDLMVVKKKILEEPHLPK